MVSRLPVLAKGAVRHHLLKLSIFKSTGFHSIYVDLLKGLSKWIFFYLFQTICLQPQTHEDAKKIQLDNIKKTPPLNKQTIPPNPTFNNACDLTEKKGKHTIADTIIPNSTNGPPSQKAFPSSPLLSPSKPRRCQLKLETSSFKEAGSFIWG